MKYAEMTPEQRQQLEEDEIEPEAIQYEQQQVDKYVFNKDTNRHILRNLMENGIKVAGRQPPGQDDHLRPQPQPRPAAAAAL